MNNRITAILGLVLACACGGAEGEQSAELGQVQEPISAKASANVVLGVTTSSTRSPCPRNNAGTICLVPGNNVLGYCIETSGMSSNVINTIRSRANSFGSLLTGFSFVESAFSDGSGHCVGQPGQNWDVLINDLKSGFCGATGGNVTNNYVCVNFPAVGGGVTPMTESIPGTFYNWTAQGTGAVLHIESTEIANRGANATQDQQLLEHAIMHGLNFLVGIGDQSALTDKWSSHSILPFSSSRGWGLGGERCRAASWGGIGSQGTYTLTSPGCGSDI